MTIIYGLEHLPLEVQDFVAHSFAERGPMLEMLFAKKGRSPSFTLESWSPAHGIDTVYLESKDHMAAKTVFNKRYRHVWNLKFSWTPLQDTRHLCAPVSNRVETVLAITTIPVNA